MGRYLRVLAGFLVSGLCLYLALRNVDFRSTWAAFSQADWRWVAAALGFVSVNNLAKAYRWKVLLGPRGEQISIGKALVSHLTGQTLNILFPFRVGDLSRAYALGGMGPGRVYVLGTVLLEKAPDMIFLVALFLALLILLPLPGWVTSSGYTLVLVALFAIMALLILAWRRQSLPGVLELALGWLPDRLRGSVHEPLQSGLPALDVLQSSRRLLKVAFWTGLIWFTAVWINYLILRALALQLPISAPLFLLLALQIGIVLPSAPGRIGVFEYICVLVLAFYGLEGDLALGYGILLHAVVFIPVAVLGLVSLGLFGFDLGGAGRSAALINPPEGDTL